MDGDPAGSCTLPDWRAVYCCAVEPREATRVTLAARTCRTAAGGPANTGFKTVQVFAAEAETSVVDSVTMVGSDNVAEGGMAHTYLAGTDSYAGHSDAGTAMGHAARLLASDEATVVGVDVNVTTSDRAVAVGHNLVVENADDAVVVGSHLVGGTPTQVLLGSHNAPSAAKLVVGGGAPGAPRNLLEVHADGSVTNVYINDLEARVTALESQLTAALAGCSA